MIITNNTGLNDSLVSAIKNDSYDRGLSDITVTQLIGPPQIRKLIKKHYDEITEDAIDRIWSLLGQAVHSILERSGYGIKEKRLYMDIMGWKLGGQFDRLAYLPNGILEDYKVTSAWSFLSPKTDWINQLNVLAYLCKVNGYIVNKLQVIAIYRDWSKFKAMKGNYPKHQVQVVNIPLWHEDKSLQYIKERVQLHQSKDFIPCTDEERWYSGDKYAVMKESRKSAVRVFDAHDEALEFCKEKNGLEIVHRPGSYKRCEGYCSVSEFCPQFNESE